MTSLHTLVSDIVDRIPDLARDSKVNQEAVLINLLKPVFDERDQKKAAYDEAMKGLNFLEKVLL